MNAGRRPLGLCRKIQVEDCASAGKACCPDKALMALHHLPADRQPDACARILVLVMQSFEHIEDAFAMFRVKADAIIF